MTILDTLWHMYLRVQRPWSLIVSDLLVLTGQPEDTESLVAVLAGNIYGAEVSYP